MLIGPGGGILDIFPSFISLDGLNRLQVRCRVHRRLLARFVVLQSQGGHFHASLTSSDILFSVLFIRGTIEPQMFAPDHFPPELQYGSKESLPILGLGTRLLSKVRVSIFSCT